MSIAFSKEYDETQTYEDGKQHAGDDKLWVKFETRAVKHEFKSNEAGRPIYYDQDYIQIIVPGSRDVSVYPMDDAYKRRFAKLYAAWKESPESQNKINGTILSELPWMTKSQIEELRYFHIHTVEQLADMSDTNAMQFMGNYKLRERAKNFLLAAAGEAPALALQQALEQRDNTIEVLQRKVADLTAAFEKMEKQRK